MLVISNLPKDNKFYILKWIGQVGKHSSKQGDYGIKLIFSAFYNSENNLSKMISHNNAFNELVYDLSIVVESSFGLLPFLPIGSIWHNQRMVNPYSELEIRTLKFDFKNNFKNIKPHATNLENTGLTRIKERIIEAKDWNIFSSNIQLAGQLSDLILISVPEQNLEILVPHHEILRTFYCDSTRLAIEFIKGTLLYDEKYLFDRDKSNLDDNGKGFIFLSKNTLNSDSKTISQFAFSEIYRKRCINHWQHLLKLNLDTNSANYCWEIAANTEPLDIKLPVDCAYKMVVNGITLDSKKDGIEQYLVLNIKRIDYDLPYSELIRDRANRNTRHEDGPKEPGSWGAVIKQPVNTDGMTEEEIFITEMLDAGSNSELHSTYNNFVAVKENMDAIKVKEAEHDEQLTQGNIKTGEDGPVSNIATTGEGQSLNNNISNFLITSHNEMSHSENRNELSNNFSILIKACKKVEKRLKRLYDNVHNKSSVNTISPDGKFYAPKVYSDKTNKLCKWSFIFNGNQKFRKRFHIQNIGFKDIQVYIMEIENNPNVKSDKCPFFIFYKKDGQSITSSEKWKLITTMTQYKSNVNKVSKWWGQPQVLPHIFKLKYKHWYHWKRTTFDKQCEPMVLIPDRERIEKLSERIFDCINNEFINFTIGRKY